MKLLFSLLIMMTIAFNCCKSFSLANNKIDYSKFENKVNQQQCFTSSGSYPSGYSSSYVSLSFNGNYPTSNGGVQQLSFLESGYIDIDFVGGQLFVNFLLDEGNTKTKGNLWAFSGNSTQYVSVNVNETDYCFQQPLIFSVPSFNGLKYVTDFELGTVQCDMFEQNNVEGNFTNQVLLVDKSDCSLLSGTTQNINSPSGYTMTNFYYYTPAADQEFFQLPSICLNPPQSTKSKLNSLLAKLPKIIQNLPF
ncbi:hypothetical protein RB653_005776 [Dictyostelium firmibasis]|uniref:Uncharacterized protein n=1 Tax=Dictyostelium firmibasis TaxID=79012 RepID=A0AAN7U7U8_9MYCE